MRDRVSIRRVNWTRFAAAATRLALDGIRARDQAAQVDTRLRDQMHRLGPLHRRNLSISLLELS
jgi:hypothetical protein